MKRRHHMPFGAEVLDDARVRFRLWAPSARSVELCLDTGVVPMTAGKGGWYERVLEAVPGARYRYRIDGEVEVSDPASRYQPEGVHGPSQVVDPGDFDWRDTDWTGRPWEQAVLYELHVGSYTPAGTFRGVAERLDYLAGLGVTAIELMPVADFAGARNWGYDGVLLYAPDDRYGHPNDLKALVQRAHGLGLMVLLDVVYNHFGPVGNYLRRYARPFFDSNLHTPWGPGINYSGRGSRWVRELFIHNALYWLEEYHLDGLRLDAVDSIRDASSPDILQEIAERVAAGPGRERQIHLVLENDDNAARYLERAPEGRPRWYRAQWNDDFHHAMHVLLTGETSVYYADYAEAPLRHLGRSLAEGYAYQGESSGFRGGRPRGEPSAGLPAGAFVNFLQNHDHVGNRAFGERLVTLVEPRRLHAALAVLLLAPTAPLLFMGEEWGSRRPFLFFCDFEPDLARRVADGRRRELLRFPAVQDPQVQHRLPHPNAPETFSQSVLDWTEPEQDEHRTWLDDYRALLALRHAAIVPLLSAAHRGGHYRIQGGAALEVSWRLGETRLTLLANLGDAEVIGLSLPAGERLYATHAELRTLAGEGTMPPWSVLWTVE